MNDPLDARNIIGNPKSVGLFSRRDMLSRLGAGMGTLGLAGVLHDATASSVEGAERKVGPHFAPKAKRIIQLFMPGGPSHVDTFDYKPDMNKFAGQRPKEVDFKSLRNTKGGLLKSPYSFQQHGECGKWVSEIFPHTAKMVDDICFIHSMHTDIPEHAGGILMMNVGHLQPVRPSMGSWMLYGLGSESKDLPGFVALCPGNGPRGGKANWGTAFLPSKYAGVKVNLNGLAPTSVMTDLRNQGITRIAQREQADLITELNRQHLARREKDVQLEAGITSMELAFRMQMAVPDAFDVRDETQQTIDMYGNQSFGKGCLLARRLVERGVRMVQVSGGSDIAWDHHGDAGATRGTAKQTDQGIGALLKDLKQRGLLEDTLVMWGGEFGRAPTAEGTKGRDHNHYGFTVWLAGGGVKGGYTHGATDRFGLRAQEKPMDVHDLHATIQHLMGIDHERLTYRHSGLDMRLTGVTGVVAKEIVA